MVARIDNEWVRCGQCGHKLFKIKNLNGSEAMRIATIDSLYRIGMEIKCHSCKTINVSEEASKDD